jgi:glucose-1-phosphate cytidylyltransferase
MKAFILCGGFGTRYNNKNKNKILKPLIKISGISVLERIINTCKKQGVTEFILLGGYKFDQLKKFSQKFSDINVSAINTGLNTETAGRLLKVKKMVNKTENFLFTYGDSLVDFSLKNSLKNKTKDNYVINVYNYKIPYGGLKLKFKNKLINIFEKKTYIPINAGFYILDKSIFSYIKNYKESFEKKTIKSIIKKNKKYFKCVSVKKWFPLDTYQDKVLLNQYIKKNNEIF